MNIRILLLAFWAVSILGFTACEEEDTNADARVRVLLTDDPGDYEAVNIDVQDVQVNPEDDDEGWVSLANVNPGVYNLLDLTGGLDTLLADAELPAGRLSQIRLVLGSDNTVQIDGEVKELMTPSAQQSGLKVQLNTDLEAGVTYTILLDFDAARSVVQAGNSGRFNLKPVIRATVDANSGSIRGTVLPADVQSLITAYNSTDTLSTYTNGEGFFLLRGVPEGTYNLLIAPDPDSALPDEELTDVAVTLGEVTDIGAVDLEN